MAVVYHRLPTARHGDGSAFHSLSDGLRSGYSDHWFMAPERNLRLHSCYMGRRVTEGYFWLRSGPTVDETSSTADLHDFPLIKMTKLGQNLAETDYRGPMPSNLSLSSPALGLNPSLGWKRSVLPWLSLPTQGISSHVKPHAERCSGINE